MLRQQELRVTLTAKNMAEGGSWLVPEFRGQKRFQKPPLAYWLTASCQKILGTTTSPVVARLPAFFFSLMLLLLIYFGGKQLLDEPTALLAAVYTGTMFLFSRYGQLAETDIILCFFTSFSAFALFCTTCSKAPLRWWMLAGICSGVGFMTKGPAAVVMPVSAWLVYALTHKPARATLRWHHLLSAAILCITISGWWYLAVYLSQSEIAQTVQQELHTVVAKGSHHKPFYYYLTKIPVSMLPWGILLPFALYSSLPSQLEGPRPLGPQDQPHGPRGLGPSSMVKYLLSWWLTTFLILSVISNKQEHYLVLLLTPTALLLGRFAQQLLSSQNGKAFAGFRAFHLGLLVMLSLLGIGLTIWAPENPAGQRLIIRLLGVLLTLFSAHTFYTLHRTKTWSSNSIVRASLPVVVLFWVYAISLHPHHRPESVIKRFATSVQHTIPNDSPVYVTGRKFETLEFYLNRPVRSVPSAIGTWQIMKPGEALVMINDESFTIDKNEIPTPPTYSTNWLTSNCQLFIK